ncbi:MAG TPA: hypothetical protein ENI51_03720 [Candidatus Atribacteria bacterium]|nr:hypothetical protein [Candidatus Atribacteria bacterium]
MGGVHFFKFLIFDWWIEFGKIRETVCRNFESGAIVDKSNWGLSQRLAKVPFSFLYPPAPSLEGKIEFLKVSKSFEK